MEWIDSEIFERDDAAVYLEGVNGILVPADLASAAPKERSAPSDLRARGMFRFSVFVMVCTWR